MSVPTRREFVQSAAAATLAIADASRLFAAKYDLLIKGGRVIDPAQRLDRVADVAISGGRIADLRENIPASDAAEVIDAQGKLVTAGLIDIHAHLTPELTPARCLSTGVTTVVDGGSRGADNVAEILGVVNGAPNRARILLNLSRVGLGNGDELRDFANADAGAARRAIEAHRSIVVGIKARLSRNSAGDRDRDVIRRAHEVTVPLNLPLMVHVGQTASTMPAIVALLRSGDIVTHVYAPPPNSILDENSRVFEEVREAQRRGVVFDIGKGRVRHITWEIAERAIQQGFLPDTISTDLTAAGLADGVFNFPTVMSCFLLLGMSLDQIIARATVNPAQAIPAFKELGTLRVGRPADVTVCELQQGDFAFVDNDNVKRIGRQRLVAHAVVAGGKRVPIS